MLDVPSDILGLVYRFVHEFNMLAVRMEMARIKHWFTREQHYIPDRLINKHIIEYEYKVYEYSEAGYIITTILRIKPLVSVRLINLK